MVVFSKKQRYKTSSSRKKWSYKKRSPRKKRSYKKRSYSKKRSYKKRSYSKKRSYKKRSYSKKGGGILSYARNAILPDFEVKLREKDSKLNVTFSNAKQVKCLIPFAGPNNRSIFGSNWDTYTINFSWANEVKTGMGQYNNYSMYEYFTPWKEMITGGGRKDKLIPIKKKGESNDDFKKRKEVSYIRNKMTPQQKAEQIEDEDLPYADSGVAYKYSVHYTTYSIVLWMYGSCTGLGGCAVPGTGNVYIYVKGGDRDTEADVTPQYAKGEPKNWTLIMKGTRVSKKKEQKGGEYTCKTQADSFDWNQKCYKFKITRDLDDNIESVQDNIKTDEDKISSDLDKIENSQDNIGSDSKNINQDNADNKVDQLNDIQGEKLTSSISTEQGNINDTKYTHNNNNRKLVWKIYSQLKSKFMGTTMKGGDEEQPKDDTQEVDVDNQDADDNQLIDATIEIIPPPPEK